MRLRPLTIVYKGLTAGLLLAVPSALFVPLNGIPHHSPAVMKGAEYACFAALLGLWICWYGLKRSKASTEGQTLSLGEFITVVLIAVPSGLIMMKAVFAVGLVLLTALSQVFR